MNRYKKTGISLFLLLAIILTNTNLTQAQESTSKLNKTIQDSADYIYKTVDKPQVGTIGGEWSIIGLARSNYDIPREYFDSYYRDLEKHVKVKKGVLHDRKLTENSRVTLALTALGKDPRDLAGYNLLTPLGDYDKIVWQGLNGPIWALIALDSGAYKMPVNSTAKTQATRQMYVDYLVESQQASGGWSLHKGGVVDIDASAMALQALARYKEDEKVMDSIDKGLGYISEKQNAKGGYSSRGSESIESTAQVLVALGELKIPLSDPRFIKNSNTVLDNLMSFYKPGKGFLHAKTDEKSNIMASEQGLYALVAAKRLIEGDNSLYFMQDPIQGPTENNKEAESSENVGLTGKHKDIVSIPILEARADFKDIKNSANKKAIKELASRKVINGKAEGIFAPKDSVTRAEFAVIIVNSLGLKGSANSKFLDIPKGAWYENYVGGASNYGIVGGVTETEFNPRGSITKEEAAAMLTRAAGLAGANTSLDNTASRNILAPFSDYTNSSTWARPSLAFCYANDIFDSSELEIKADEPMTREEISQAIFNMLEFVNLL